MLVVKCKTRMGKVSYVDLTVLVTEVAYVYVYCRTWLLEYGKVLRRDT